MTASQACPYCVRLEVQNAQLKADFDKLKVNFSHFSQFLFTIIGNFHFLKMECEQFFGAQPITAEEPNFINLK